MSLQFQKIRDLIIDNNLKIVRSHRTIITYKEAELFYEEHKEKFFYNRLLTFMCSGPSDIHILADHNAIAKWRQLMGPTKVYQAQYIAPDTIRGMYGLSDTRNATHGSGILSNLCFRLCYLCVILNNCSFRFSCISGERNKHIL